MPQYKINNKFIDVTCHNTQDCVFKNIFPNTEKRQKKMQHKAEYFWSKITEKQGKQNQIKSMLSNVFYKLKMFKYSC